MDKISVVSAVIVVLITLMVGSIVYQEAASGDALEFTEKSEAWCDRHNGTLENSMVLGEHGGLHCKLPNGTTVHMDRVIEV